MKFCNDKKLGKILLLFYIPIFLNSINSSPSSSTLAGSSLNLSLGDEFTSRKLLKSSTRTTSRDEIDDSDQENGSSEGDEGEDQGEDQEEDQDGSKKAPKAGPHGHLILPQYGKTVKSVGGLGLLSVKFSKYNGQEGQTTAIDLTLKPLKTGNGAYTLATGLNSPRNQNEISAVFSNKWACGSYKLIVREHQLYKGVHISFQVAAPRIKFSCIPIQK